MEPEPEPEPPPGDLRAICWKQKPTVRTWHERHVVVQQRSLRFFDEGSAADEAEARGSSIEDVSGCSIATGLEYFRVARATWFRLDLCREGHATLPDAGAAFCFADEHVRDRFAGVLQTLASEGEPAGVVITELPRGSISFRFPEAMLEPVPVKIDKGEPALICAEGCEDPCGAALFKLGICSIEVCEPPSLTAIFIYSHRVQFRVKRSGAFQFTAADGSKHTTRCPGAGIYTLDFNAADATITEVRRRAGPEAERLQWPELGSEVEVWSATANMWVGAVVESVDGDNDDEVTVLYTVDGEKRGKVVHKNDRDNLRMRRQDTPRQDAQPADLEPEPEPEPQQGGARIGRSKSVDSVVSESSEESRSRAGSFPDRFSSLRSSWTTEDQVPTDRDEAFAGLLPRLPDKVTAKWLQEAGGGPLFEDWLENEKLKWDRSGSGKWERWRCILWPKQAHPEHGRLLVCFEEAPEEEEKEKDEGEGELSEEEEKAKVAKPLTPVQVIRLKDPSVLPPTKRREDYFAMRLEAHHVEGYSSRDDQIIETRRKWILGRKEKPAMEAWLRHIPLHLPFLKRENMGWESTESLQAPSPRALSPEVGRRSFAVPGFEGGLNPPNEWEEISSGGYGTVFRAMWHSSPVAVKVLKSAKVTEKPKVMADWDEEKIEQATEIVKGGEDIPGKLAELGVNGLLVPSVIEYCRAITARSTHRQDFDREVQMVFSAQHPFVVQCFGVHTGVSPLSNEQERMLVMDIANRGSLWSFLRDRRRRTVSLGVRALMAQGIAAGIHFLHEKKLVHLDLKSLNILIFGDRPKICDFGAAQPESAVHASSFTPGTGAWMAPEVALSGQLKMPADIYSFGVILWELLTVQDVLKAWKSAAQGTPRGGRANIIPLWAHEGVRPPLPADAGVEWTRLVSDCWQTDPSARPTIEEIQGRCAQLEQQVAEPEPEPQIELQVQPEQPEPEPEPELEPEPEPEPQPQPAVQRPPHRLDDSITPVEAWLTQAGLAYCIAAATESAEYCDIDDFETLLDSGQEHAFAACVRDLAILDGDVEKLKEAIRVALPEFGG